MENEEQEIMGSPQDCKVFDLQVGSFIYGCNQGVIFSFLQLMLKVDPVS